MQLDQGNKGFSFSKEGPLDMRMDPEGEVTAADIVNSYSEEKLGKIFREMGEEPQWKKAARAVALARSHQPIERTNHLASILASALSPKKGGRLHPATLVFQALRIAVNRELEAIESGLLKALRWLAPGGRIGAISFHSLEDRIVKNVFRLACFRPQKGSRKESGCLKIITKKPLTPTDQEARVNPRSRSAKLRLAEKVES